MPRKLITYTNMVKPRVGRIRYFYKFETPTTISVTQEITFHNNTDDKTLSRIIFDLKYFRPFLHIYDTDRTLLEYYGISSTKEHSNLVVIFFPRDKKIYPNEFRTISIEYYKELETNGIPDKCLSDIQNERCNTNDLIRHDEHNEYSSYGEELPLDPNFSHNKVYISSKLHNNATTYVFIKKCEGYVFNYTYWVKGVENKRVKNNLKIDESKTFLHIGSESVIFNNTLFIEINHDIHKTLSGDIFSWNNIGLYMGGIALITVLIMDLKNPANIIYSIALVTIVISTMVFIKEWLLLKNLDTHKLDMYDYYYRVIIILLFAEISILFIYNSLI